MIKNPFVTLIFLFILGVANSQYKFKLKEHVAPASLMFISGMADGMRDALQFRYDRVDAKLRLNDRFWNPAESWKNKYKNNDPAQGAKFPGSTGPLVFVTDGVHLMKFVDNLFTVGAISIKVTQYKKKWYVYILEGFGYWAVNRIGFGVVYYRF